MVDQTLIRSISMLEAVAAGFQAVPYSLADAGRRPGSAGADKAAVCVGRIFGI
jgi:hypothetical protein